MKIATFNINNINRRLPNLLRWLRAAKPDIVSLQELKSTDADFPLSTIEKAGYGAVWRGQKTWNGVAILARNADPVLIRTELPGGPDDREARYIEAAVSGIIVTSIYLPNGNPQPGPKFDYKLDWFRRLKLHAAKFLKQDIPVVLAGDYNVAPTELDIYPTRSWDKDALIQPKSRAAFKSLVAQGWCDHLLGLQAKPLAARRRIEARSSSAQPGNCATPDQGGRRPHGTRRRRRQRPRAGVDHPELDQRKPFCIGGDMLAVAADDGRGRRAGHQAHAGFEHRIDLLVHHQPGLASRVVVADREFRQPKMDDFAGLECQHGAGEPGKAGITFRKDVAHRVSRSFELEMS